MNVLQLDLSNSRGLEKSTSPESQTHRPWPFPELCSPGTEKRKSVWFNFLGTHRVCWVMLAWFPAVHSLGASVKSQFCGAKGRDGSEGVKRSWNSRSEMPAHSGFIHGAISAALPVTRLEAKHLFLLVDGASYGDTETWCPSVPAGPARTSFWFRLRVPRSDAVGVVRTG